MATHSTGFIHDAALTGVARNEGARTRYNGAVLALSGEELQQERRKFGDVGILPSRYCLIRAGQ
jgi:hypothetical protein